MLQVSKKMVEVSSSDSDSEDAFDITPVKRKPQELTEMRRASDATTG